MRTMIRGGWVVGYRDPTHTLIPDGVAVYENDRILHVGRSFEGQVDRVIEAKGMLVSPGFIDTHVHCGHRASHRLITDAGRPDYFGQPFLEISVPREGTRIGGDPRYAGAEAMGSREMAVWCDFTVAELLRNGITTFVEFGAGVTVQEGILASVERFGIRGYLGPGYDIGRWVGDETGRLKRVADEQKGRQAMEAAHAFVQNIEGKLNGRVRGILVPREVETCSIEQMNSTVRLAGEWKMPVAIHAAYNIHEFYDIVRDHLKTPIELLDELRMLQIGPTLNIGHGNLVAEHPRLAYSNGHDIEIMGRNGCSVSHCPVNLVRRARFLDHWDRYVKAGVNMAMGTDTYPRDMIMQMRTASYFGKVLSKNLGGAPAASVYEAATLGGARSLGRSDLGRLCAGAKADIVLINQKGGDSLRYGPVRDPIKSLVECGIGDDVDTVIVDGVVRMEGRRIPGLDINALRAEAQAAGEYQWDHWHEWDPLGRRAEVINPWSFPLAES